MRLNTALAYSAPKTAEGAPAARITPYKELRRLVLTCMLWEDSAYQKGSDIAAQIAQLCKTVDPYQIAALAREARDKMKLRHIPLYLVRQLARRSKEQGVGSLVEGTLQYVIQRADELSEFCAIYWEDAKKDAQGRRSSEPLSAAVKRGLAAAFQKFDEYRLAKYVNRDSAVKLRDVLFLSHARPKDKAQAEVWKKLVDGTMTAPDTWEVELSAGKDKKETFTRLLAEGKLGGLAVLRNLRNMQQAGEIAEYSQPA